jgi:TRAP-type C4-dicarboxylate transport system substrate-binding protein
MNFKRLNEEQLNQVTAAGAGIQQMSAPDQTLQGTSVDGIENPYHVIITGGR